MQGILLQIRYFEIGLSKRLEKLTLFFFSNSVPFTRQDYAKQKGPVRSDLLLFKLQNKFRKTSFLVMYYLIKFDDVI